MEIGDLTKRINPETQIVGVFGYPVKHSASPAMHNAAFSSSGLNYIYLSFEVKPEEIEKALKALPVLGIKGVNLTIPHKEIAMPYMDNISEEALNVGAVNTVKVDSGVLSGYNTDVEGFLNPLSEKGWQPEGRKAVVLGAGGAARAVVFALLSSAVSEIVVANRNLERAGRLSTDMQSRFPAARVAPASIFDSLLFREISDSSLLVNATPLGMKGEMPLGKTDCIHPGLIVYDLVYNPNATPLLEESGKRGADTIGGLGMLVYQGAASFRIWTSVDAPVEIMKNACEQALFGRGK